MAATFFASYDAARAHSEMIRQGAARTASVDHAAAAAAIADASPTHSEMVRQGPVSVVAHATHVAAVAVAEQQHQDRLAAAGTAFGVRNGATGDGRAEHALRWLSTGNAS